MQVILFLWLRASALIIAICGVASSFDGSCQDQDVSIFYQKGFHVTSPFHLPASKREDDLREPSMFLDEDGFATRKASGGEDNLTKVVGHEKEVLKNVTDDIKSEKLTTHEAIGVERKILEYPKGDRRVVRHIVYNKTSIENGSNITTNASSREAFAKANRTVREHVIRLKKHENTTVNVTVKDIVKTVEIASATDIFSIYLIMFVPIIATWVTYFQWGLQPKHYMMLLAVTACITNVGSDLANQSLILLVEAPFAISSIHAYGMTIVGGLWLMIYDRPNFREMQLCKLSSWLIVCVLFSGSQLANHVAYTSCTLSERTVFLNLLPLVSLVCEQAVMPGTLKPVCSFFGKMALSMMLVGAILFSLQSPSFSAYGVSMASLLVFATIPYRFAQRYFLGDGAAFPISLLCFLDGLVFSLFSTAITISRSESEHLSEVRPLLYELPVVVMLVLSTAAIVGGHWATLAMLRTASATSFLVVQSLAGLLTIGMGIIFFGDRVLATPLACVGLLANVVSAVWYSVVETPSFVESKVPPEKSDGDKENAS